MTTDATPPTADRLDVEEVLAALTLEEKASLLSGDGPWHTKPVDRVGVPRTMVADGPHGLRKQPDVDHVGLGDSVPATCFPPAVTLGSTWDVALLRRVGEALGRETRANQVGVLLGPGINIKRSPLCGRNFEYLSEDPVVSGELGAALVDGIQSQGVGTSLKHYAANNQETDRMRVSADVDERTLREIYLAGFERVVTRARPWTVMCSYNRINGVHASQHAWLLTQVLREEWGFDGLVVSDWGAVHDRVAALEAGLDLQMPGTGGRTDGEVVEAVRQGRLDEEAVDRAVRRVLRLVDRALPALREPGSYDVEGHHELAREAAADGAVLLRNERVGGVPVLPLDAERAEGLVVVGELARTPRYQGAGSSQVNPTRLDDALVAIRSRTGSDVPFAAGYALDGDGPDGLRDEAVDLCRGAGTVLLFLGLPATYESEGYDRRHMDLPAQQVALLEAVTAVADRVVVVLANGAAVTVAPWRDRTAAILECWLGGQAGGSAAADLLFGDRTPSGRLAETLPLRLEDNPSYGSFPGELGHVRYGEGVLVGYRYYDARRMAVAYPFGHGLSYTSFGYDDLSVTVAGEGPDVRVDVTVRVTNTGDRSGAEVVQVYVGDPRAQVLRPQRELKAFTKLRLDPGAAERVSLSLTARDLSYWHPVLNRWVVEGGTFRVAVGASSRDIRGEVEVDVTGEDVSPPVDEWSTVGELLADPVVGPVVREHLEGGHGAPPLGSDMAAMALDMPARVLADFRLTSLTREVLDDLLR
jgi:beta-glucosidase